MLFGQLRFPRTPLFSKVLLDLGVFLLVGTFATEIGNAGKYIVTTGTRMADIFIKIDGIAGESQDAIHPDEIEVLSWHWKMAQQSAMHSGSGGGAGKATVSDLHFMHGIDRASPNLASYCFHGKHIPQVLLTMRKAGGIPLEYLKIRMYDVIVSHVEAAVGDGIALEHVALSFARMKKEYAVQSAIGGSQGMVTAIIDVKQNLAD